ncbi:helix-turn-helix domain-containing protein [Streptomyces sp. RerS4]|uniref:helix-turn-helix domain-containing protein n=1 Tax=Streptomyces sp. RerS4 TaxID=2942449 RepID=UPI00201C67ED|nr:helix-turn-helix domain-containing protein [Streptomyces sp. RerS4]UQX05394.1 helix-turn-helix domain-containing protein [Streptomyces sp. RerS4]
MLEQPSFGRRLRQLRTERGLAQSAVAGEGMSAGYLSRLESGARQPTERAVAYLAERLGISPAEFEQTRAGSLVQSLTIATSLDSDETGELLAEALKSAREQDPLLRWQSLWLLAQWKRRRGELAQERAYLDELVHLGDETGLTELRARGLTQLARCMRASGEIGAAIEASATAHRLARDGGLSRQDMATALLVLVSVEAEAGRLPEARGHADELTTLVEGQSDALWAEAMWTAAAVRVRQGEFAPAQDLLERALQGYSGRENLTLWLRLRVAAARLHLQKFPPEPDVAQQYVEAAESGLPFAGTPALEQELMALGAELAFLEGRIMDARALLDRLGRSELRMTYRDRVRLEVLGCRLLLLEGAEEEGLAGLQRLAAQAQEAGSVDLAADIWRLTTESLVRARERTTTPAAVRGA